VFTSYDVGIFSSGLLSSCLAKWIVSPLCQQRPLLCTFWVLKTVIGTSLMKLRHKVSWLMGAVQKSLFPYLDECLPLLLTDAEKN